MANTYVPSTHKSFDFGRVLNRTFASIRDNWRSFSLASIVIIGIPYFLVNLIPALSGVFASGVISGGDVLANYMGILIGVGVLTAIVVMISTFVLQSLIIHTAIKDFQGQSVGFSESFGVALKYLLPVLGFGILGGLGILLGFILLIVPGIILALMWYVAVPVMIVEKTGVMGAFGRSAELTSGNKWWILLTVIVLGLIGAVVSALILAVSLIFGVPTQDAIIMQGAATAPLILYAAANGVATAFSTLIGAVGVAAVYYELRYIKEGIEAESIGDVFS